MMPAIRGRVQYRALVGMAYPTDPAIIRRLKAGENLPLGERRIREVAVGDIVDDIPADAVPKFLAKGYIERIAEVAEDPPVVTTVEEEEVSA